MKNLLKKVNLFYKIATDINQLSKKEIRNLLESADTDLSEVINSIDDNTSKWVLHNIYENNQYNHLRKLIIEKAIETDNNQVLSDVAKYGAVEDLRLISEKINSDYLLSMIVDNRNADIKTLENIINKLNIDNNSYLYKRIKDRIIGLENIKNLNIKKDLEYQKMDNEIYEIFNDLGYKVL